MWHSFDPTGIPLVAPDDQQIQCPVWISFFQGAVCMGDLLNEAGYDLNYLGGAILDLPVRASFIRHMVLIG